MVMRLPAGFLVQSMSDFNVGVDPMQTLGHQWIDVLKMDIEGSEYKSLGFLANLPGDAMRFTQLQLELHQQWAPDPSKPNVAQFDCCAVCLVTATAPPFWSQTSTLLLRLATSWPLLRWMSAETSSPL
jgi:hypothetical protein